MKKRSKRSPGKTLGRELKQVMETLQQYIRTKTPTLNVRKSNWRFLTKKTRKNKKSKKAKRTQKAKKSQKAKHMMISNTKKTEKADNNEDTVAI